MRIVDNFIKDRNSQIECIQTTDIKLKSNLLKRHHIENSSKHFPHSFPTTNFALKHASFPHHTHNRRPENNHLLINGNVRPSYIYKHTHGTKNMHTIPRTQKKNHYNI